MLVNSADSFRQGQSGIEELLSQMTKAVLELALETEISNHPRIGNHTHYGWAIKWDRFDE